MNIGRVGDNRGRVSGDNDRGEGRVIIWAIGKAGSR